MKKLISVMFLLTLVLTSFAQSLNNSAKSLKSNDIDIYNAIKYKAQEDFPGDHTTTLFVINQQADAYYELGALSNKTDFDWDIFSKSLDMFSKPASKGESKYSDWTTILYYYKQQIEAKSAY